MTTIAETAAREAEEAEQEYPDEPLEDDEAEDETQEAAADEPEAERDALAIVQERQAKLDSERKSHRTRFKNIIGDDFDKYDACAICDGDGFVPATQETADLIVAVAETINAAKSAAGDGLRTPEYILQCENCGGFGEIATTARGKAVRTTPCKRCAGRGWFDTEDLGHRAQLGLDRPVTPAPAPVNPFPTFHTSGGGTATLEAQPPAGWHASGSPGADNWNRWPGHPRYGVDPDTAGGQW